MTKLGLFFYKMSKYIDVMTKLGLFFYKMSKYIDIMTKRGLFFCAKLINEAFL